MAKSSEDVLLVINQVKNKKCDGSLYVMSERIAWMPAVRNTFTYSYNYSDIKTQKISPDTKDKVQLQLVLHSSGANTFQFSNPAGRAAQLSDREGVKDHLQRLLPQFRVKMDSELEEKNKLLRNDPALFQLYKDLVASDIMPPEEFWNDKMDTLKTKATERQDIGVSAAFLADIRPVSDGCNGMRYNLTSDIIESIFRTYPSVRDRHAEYVPEKLTEQDFWAKFFQSHYFHRDHRPDLTDPSNIFAACAKRDDDTMQAELLKPLVDPFLDLSSLSDNTLDEAYRDGGDDCSAVSNPANAALMKRFNQYSAMVLKSSNKRPMSKSLPAAGAKVNGSGPAGPSQQNDSQPSTSQASSNEVASKKAKLKEKTEIDDLEVAPPPPSIPSLTLTQVGAYFHGPTPEMVMQYNTSEDLIRARDAHSREIMSWSSQPTQVLPPAAAYKVLQELSSAIIQSSTKQQMLNMVSEVEQQEVRNLYIALSQILKKFWGCFPVTSKELEDKLVHTKDMLQEFERKKLDKMSAQQSKSSFSHIDLTRHMRSMINAACAKFNVWHAKKMAKQS